MTDVSARFGLPFIQPGQAQKEVFHNEALALIDSATHSAAETRGDNVPPNNPIVGQGWIIGLAPAGDWNGRSENLARWTAGGWRFLEPVEGMQIWLKNAGMFAQWTGSEWRDGNLVGDVLVIAGQTVVSAQQSAVNDVVGGTVIDQEARAVVTSILATLRSHGLIAT